jgi:hypothetical protein
MQVEKDKSLALQQAQYKWGPMKDVAKLIAELFYRER